MSPRSLRPSARTLNPMALAVVTTSRVSGVTSAVAFAHRAMRWLGTGTGWRQMASIHEVSLAMS